MSQGPLSGVRVIDLTIAAAGPYAASILAGQGAEVIKVERPDGGDFMRRMGAVNGGVAATFVSWNRGKQSICIDLAQPAGAELVRRLAATADIIMHNLRPGNAEKMGLGYEQVRAVKPDIIYAFLTGWGEVGPQAGEPAYDSVVQAASGIAAIQASPADGIPVFVRSSICDKTSGLTFSQLITAALFRRARSGQGQRLHMSMLHSSLSFAWGDGMQQVAFLDAPKGGGRASTYPVRRTLDGWMSVSCNLDTEFQALCRVLERPDLAADPRFAAFGERSRNSDALWKEIDPMLAQRRSADLVAAFRANRVPNAVVNTPENVHEDEQVQALGALEVFDHPEAGRTRVAHPVGDFSATPLATPERPPRLGEHTDAVLAGLGLGAAEIAKLRAAGTVA
jgi:crotonobetainyl-CoA:carnitine CoA-transferase CaiB-like acyl-CoA transferase